MNVKIFPKEPAPSVAVTRRINADEIFFEERSRPPHCSPAFGSNLEGALWWFEFGYRVMPIVPGQKRPALHYFPWLDQLSVESIQQHWRAHPDHEVGAVLEQDQMVLDADSDESNEALIRLEQQSGVEPALIIKTRKGYHHHFRLTKGAFAKPDAHYTEEYPDRIDVRASKNSIVLIPSRDKSFDHLTASNRSELGAVDQDFIDSVFQHNGKPVPRPIVEDDDADDDEKVPATTELATLAKLLDCLDPERGYQDWVNALMAIYHETAGSEEGLELANSWSAKGESYKGRAEIESKWRSFSGKVTKPITVGTLIARARAEGHDVADIVTEQFQRSETPTIVIRPPAPAKPARKSNPSPFQKFSLQGQAGKFAAMAQDTRPLLGNVCQKGELTVWYARHNTGKTLLCLHLISEAVEKRRINPSDIFYINADDSSSGVAAKLGLLDEIGAHTLVPGQNGFKAQQLEELLKQAVQNDAARGTLIVIDTLKKFVDLMHKRQAADFATTCRQFAMAGGTMLGLAHVNKRRSEDGKAIYAGTSDILDDFDAGYILDVLPMTGNPGEKFVEFTREKARGGGVQAVAYRYAAEDGVSYPERLASVAIVDPAELDGMKQAEQVKSDAEIVTTLRRHITAGVNTKIALRDAVATQMQVSRRAIAKVIEAYTGPDPTKHHWSFEIKDRGAMAYSLLSQPTDPAPETAPPGS